MVLVSVLVLAGIYLSYGSRGADSAEADPPETEKSDAS